MKFLPLLVLPLITGCSAMMPDMFKTIDDMATDTAIKVEVDKEAFKKETDVHIIVDVINKDEKAGAK